jgi:hypothetical protein
MSSKIPIYFFVVLVALAYYAHCRRHQRIEASLLKVDSKPKTENLSIGFMSREVPLPENDLTMLNTKDSPEAVILLGGVQVPQKAVLFAQEPTRVFPELDMSHRNRYSLYDTTKL